MTNSWERIKVVAHTPTTIRQALRGAIKPYHDAAEAGILARLRAQDLAVEEYDCILGGFLCLHEAMSGWVVVSPCPPWSDYFIKALRLGELQSDITVRGIAIPKMKADWAVKAFSLDSLVWKNEPEVWAGLAYVLIGSLLGARVIRNELQKSLGLDEKSGASFFSPALFGVGSENLQERFFSELERTDWSAQQREDLLRAAAELMRSIAVYWSSNEPL